MLEITNLRDGAVLNRHHGVETEEYLEIKVEGLADSPAQVTVNGMAAVRSDRNFSAAVRLTEKINKIIRATGATVIPAHDAKVGEIHHFPVDD